MKHNSTFNWALLAIALVLGGFMLPTKSDAAVVGTYDTNDTITAIYGTGNPDTNWVSAEGGDVQVAVRFHVRHTADYGLTPGTPVFTFTTAPGKQISLDFSAATFNGKTLADYTFTLAIDTDPSAAQNFTLFQFIPGKNDNSYGTSTTLNGQGVEGNFGVVPNATVAQNSQLPGWIASVDANQIGTFDVYLGAAPNAGPNAGIDEARTESTLQNVPEPSGSALSILAVLGLTMSRRRRAA